MVTGITGLLWEREGARVGLRSTNHGIRAVRVEGVQYSTVFV